MNDHSKIKYSDKSFESHRLDFYYVTADYLMLAEPIWRPWDFVDKVIDKKKRKEEKKEDILPTLGIFYSQNFHKIRL